MSENPNPKLFEQGERYADNDDAEGFHHEFSCRSLWTEITLRDIAAMVFAASILSDSENVVVAAKLAEKLSVGARQLIHQHAFEHADLWLAARAASKETP